MAATSPSRDTPMEEPLTAEEQARYDRLGAWRLARSRLDKVPAYVVFGNKVMRELARRRPTTDEALLDVPGIGPHKLASYGEELKKILNSTVNLGGREAKSP